MLKDRTFEVRVRGRENIRSVFVTAKDRQQAGLMVLREIHGNGGTILNVHEVLTKKGTFEVKLRDRQVRSVFVPAKDHKQACQKIHGGTILSVRKIPMEKILSVGEFNSELFEIDQRIWGFKRNGNGHHKRSEVMNGDSQGVEPEAFGETKERVFPTALSNPTRRRLHTGRSGPFGKCEDRIWGFRRGEEEEDEGD